MNNRKLVLIFGFLVSISITLHGRQSKPLFFESCLWYKSPASHWLEALPLGNGSLGAMVFGESTLEKIQFNESSLTTGTTKEMGNYQPFGDVYLDWGMKNIENYKRKLSLDSAIHTINYTSNGVKYTHEYFISHIDNVLVLKISANKPKAIDVQIKLKDARPNTTKASQNNLVFQGVLPSKLVYEAILSVKNIGGQTITTDSSLKIKKADYIICYVAAGTSFKTKSREDYLGYPPHEKLNSIIKNAQKLTYTKLKERHLKDYSGLYGRVNFSLGKEINNLPTNERFLNYSLGNNDFNFESLVFQYGRYLLISSSRPGGLPTNLQGIWNAEFKPAWYSQYTTNINLEMNYWLAEQTNLSECHFPFFDWVENLAQINKKSDDPLLFAKKGWIAYSTNNIMGGNSKWRVHKPGSAWLSQHFWEHYQFTRDEDFLKNRAYPLLKDVVSYWESHLVLSKNGKYITPDGWSPEHGPFKNEKDTKPYPGVSYDQQIIYDLFTNYLDASKHLNVNGFHQFKIQNMRDSLLGPQIGRWGQLQEWMEDVDDSTDHHRHNSHLFAVHPGKQISYLTSYKFAEAAKKSILSRGEKGTGWATAWRINILARLLDGDQAHKLIRTLVYPAKPTSNWGDKVGLYPNLFDAHPPFQIDGNFGYTAGVAEMLLQSQNGIIHILPALPSKWKEGHISGLKSRGNVEVEITWENNRVVSFTLKPKFKGSYTIQYGENFKNVTLIGGKVYKFSRDFFSKL